MRADYATSDLISKVNSDWINEVLAHREFRRADPEEVVAKSDATRNDVTRNDVADETPVDAVHEHPTAASDLRLRREFARKRAILLQRGSTDSGHHEPDIAIDPFPHRYRRRSVARRIKERLALAVVALAMVGAAAWMAAEPQDATGSMSTRAASAAPEPAPVDTAELQPAWLVPEILYGPAMARSPVSRAEAPRPAPKPGR
jgi:hypothetical protein